MTETTVEQMTKIWMDAYKKVLAQREEILIAFIAKYGCEPNQIVQIEHKESLAVTRWWVEKRKDNPMKTCTGCSKTEFEILEEAGNVTYDELDKESVTLNCGDWYCHTDCLRDAN